MSVSVSFSAEHFKTDVHDTIKIFFSNDEIEWIDEKINNEDSDNENIKWEKDNSNKYNENSLSNKDLGDLKVTINHLVKDNLKNDEPKRNSSTIQVNVFTSGLDDNKQYILDFKGQNQQGLFQEPFNFQEGHEDFIRLKKGLKWKLRRFLYDILLEETGKKLPWGLLIGIRPVKLAMEFIDEGLSRTQVIERMIRDYRISKEKAIFLNSIAEKEKKILDNTPENSVGLYIGIPFCPSRCLYCSFTSEPIEHEAFMKTCSQSLDETLTMKESRKTNHALRNTNKASLISGGDYGKNTEKVLKYLQCLEYELAETSKLLLKNGQRVQSIYIGGGTPTALGERELEILFQMIEKHLDLSILEEFTVEAGRADSLTLEKLEIIKTSKANRISINPQTMNDKTLQRIGRNHTTSQFIEMFKLARKVGFNNINTDIIIGLPDEGIENFENTMKGLELLMPDSITVHTLAIKKGSRLIGEYDKYQSASEEEAKNMMDLAYKYADKMGLSAYYLYRQKYMLGNLENTGLCRPGCESVYNIQIMEEKQSIIAVGAGAVSKLVYPKENRIERIFNMKFTTDYIKRIDEMVERKKSLMESIH